MPDTNSKHGRQSKGGTKSDRVRALLTTGMPSGEIAKKVGCTVNLVYVLKSKMKNPGRPGPGRPPKARGAAGVSRISADGIAGILAAVQNTERERAQLRGTLERLQAMVAAALVG